VETQAKVNRLSELQAGQQSDCFALLARKERAKTRDGKSYFRVQFRDAVRTATVMIWSDSAWHADCEAQWTEGEFYKLRCRYEESKYGPQLELDRIRSVEESDREQGFDPGEFFKTTRHDVETMFAELQQIARDRITEKPLQQLVMTLLERNATLAKKVPAAARYHHAFSGGWLEHTLSMTQTAVYFATKYAAAYPDMNPPLSKPLVVAGAILHDIGKMMELEYHPEGAKYTARGRLVGHILLGRDMVREAGREIPDLSPETLLRLEHIIVAHQNLPEWGSPVAPHTPEALLVYFADDTDAKFQEIAAALESEPEENEEFTGVDNVMRRRLFRGLKPTE
jgi:3'-5' exoribonuclease